MQEQDKLTILLTGDIDQARMAELQAIAADAQIHHFPSDAAMAEAITDATIVAGSVSAATLSRAHSLKWLHSWAAGPNSQLFQEMIDSPVLMTCSKGNGAIPLAEHAIMLMLMLNRDAMRWINAQRERKWSPFMHGELAGLTVAILGTGFSGQDLAHKCKAFHMRTIGLRRNARPTDGFDQIYGRDELHGFLSEADFVVVTAPNTPETSGMLGAAEFRAMKPSAYYICYSRGGIADDAALYRALDEGWIAGAGLDAHGIEPLPEDSPFWALPNTIITPHNGATTRATKDRGYLIFRDNLKRWIAGEPLTNVVDKRGGY